MIIYFIRERIYQRKFPENLKRIGQLGRELFKIKFFDGKCAAKSSKHWRKFEMDNTCLCTTASVLPFSGWFMVWMAASTGRFGWRVCLPEHYARGSLKWSSRSTSAWLIRLWSSDAWEGRRKARMRLSKPSWSGICGPNRGLLGLNWWSYQHIWLQTALIINLSPSWLFYAKIRMHD